MDDHELAKISKDDDVIIVFAFGQKYAFKMTKPTEKYLKVAIANLDKRLTDDFNSKVITPYGSKSFSVYVGAGKKQPCIEPTCVHTFTSDKVMHNHIEANHPEIYKILVQKHQIKNEPKAIEYL